MSGNIKTATIKREGDSWYVIFACEDVVIDSNKYNKTDNKVSGIDLGISAFATLSDGEKIHHSRHLKEAKEKFVRLHQELSSKKKGSKNRAKTKNRLAKAHNKVKNARTNEFHHIANELINTHDQIFIEDLDIAEMLDKKSAKKKNEKKKKEGKSVMSEKSASTLRFNILDAAWGKFVNILQYKAEEASNVIITKVPARNTSKMCSCCGNIKTDLQLYDRVYYCSNVSCQARLDRDINAAINIKKKGLEQTLP